MNKEQAKAYATVTLDLLFKMKVKITPMVLSEQMELIYDLYDLDEIINEYSKIKNDKTFVKATSSKANCYIINIFNTANKQKKDFEANFLSDCVIISDEKVFEVDEKGIKMKVNYKVERNIGVKREIGILH